jgi:beta-glucosidase/6-phospho-beta-glucosidase/beta-galactosidase
VKAAAPSAQVGIVYNVQAVSPRNPSRKQDVQAAYDLSYLMNQVFLNAVARGDFDAKLDGTAVHRADLEGRCDFIGVNYYLRATVEGLGSSLFPDQSPYMTFNPFTMVLASDAAGIGEVLDWLKSYRKPIYITETGQEDAQDTGTAASWIGTTLRETRRAIGRGADVRGYFYWTLMDNYEWNHGMTWKLGLYGVDPADPAKARTPRPKAIAALASAAQSGRAPPGK